MFSKYTRQEITVNNGKDNRPIWIIINNNVYDVSNYLDSHPGGRDLLLEWAGKDATRALADIGHSNDAHKVMDNFKIGELIEGDTMINNKKTSAFLTNEIKKKKRFSILLCR